MAKRIKNISELPKWFHLDNYKSAKKFKASEWYEQLLVRENCHTIMESHKYDLDEDLIAGTQDFADVLKLLRENPIVDVTSNKLLWSYFCDTTLINLKKKNPYSEFGVRPITLDDFFHLADCLDEKKLPSTSFQQHNDKPINNYMNQFSSPPFVAFINWDLPDVQLIEHFKHFIKSYRETKFTVHTTKDYNEHVRKCYRKPDFNTWYRLGILPYLDLKLWALETDVTIPNRVMADAIYTSGEDGEETVRKTTAPLANILISETAINALSYQAALEIAENNKK